MQHKFVMAQPGVSVEREAKVENLVSLGARCCILPYAVVGERSVLGAYVLVDREVRIGRNVHVGSYVTLVTGVLLEDDVVCGTGCVFGALAEVPAVPKDPKRPTWVRRGARLGAHATIALGVTIGKYACVAEGAVVTDNVMDYALMAGAPATRQGWVSRHGHRLTEKNAAGEWVCPVTGWRYAEAGPEVLRCLDWPEDEPLPKP